ncbi:MAG TPA: V-type ATP synthase subunit F [Candidatus Hydrogenedentes bacterium]|nr:V-type ATP synthase subunit F [Candidatus Hydrogenedentota bacterium]HNT87547.1 V-type ATP synthase subunit F [Candidatus Hydrogenedentota bacterium]
MATNIVAIGQPTMSLGLGLTGVRVHETRDVKEADALIEELLAGDTEVLIIDESLRDKLSEWRRNRLARHKGRPLVIYCPAFEEEEAGTDAYINAILKPAVGFEIRLD